MNYFAAFSLLAMYYASVSSLYLMFYWVLTFVRFKARPHRDSFLALGMAVFALWQSAQAGDSTGGYVLLFFACLFVTGAIMVAGAVVNKARTQIPANSQ